MKNRMTLRMVCRCLMLCVFLPLQVLAQSTQSKKAFVGEPISMNFQNVEVRSALQILAQFTGLNVVAADSVNGSLSLHLQQVPWDQVLDLIAQAKGLS
ncbi:MAG: hypothetical protein ACOVKR_10860, partial [Limnohabitans sp.]